MKNLNSRPNSALILIDLQNDFFDSEGFLQDHFIDATRLMAPISALLSEFRGKNPVIWI